MLKRLVDPHGNIGRLFVNRSHHCAGAIVKSIVRVGITDPLHRPTDNGRDIGIVGGGDLSHHRHHASGSKGFTSNMGGRVMGNDIVQNSIGNLVADLIGMSFRHRF